MTFVSCLSSSLLGVSRCLSSIMYKNPCVAIKYLTESSLVCLNCFSTSSSVSAGCSSKLNSAFWSRNQYRISWILVVQSFFETLQRFPPYGSDAEKHIPGGSLSLVMQLAWLSHNSTSSVQAFRISRTQPPRNSYIYLLHPFPTAITFTLPH